MLEKTGLAFINLTLSVNSFFKKKIILNDVGATFEIGSINGLMGTSGSGKSSLLKCLYGSSKYILDDKSKIYRNSTQELQSCFINQNQNERLLKGLTVKQSLIYASKLKNSDQNNTNHKYIVEEILKEFVISDIEDSYVEKCSGGQIKRLTIALELVAQNKPNILLIDEPTTGLDSSAAEMVIDCLRNLSRNHRTLVFASIHQPNNELLLKFDSIYVLAKEGVCIYWGRPHSLRSSLLECSINCNEVEVPIEVLLELSSKGMNDKCVQRLYHKNYTKYSEFKEKCDKEMILSINGIKQKPKSFRISDFWNLLLRTMIYTYFSKFYTFLVQLIFVITFAIFFSKAYHQNIGQIDGCFSIATIIEMSCLEMSQQKTILEENVYFIFSSTLVLLMIQISITTSLYIRDMKSFSAEHQNNWYSTGSYYLAKSLVEMISSITFSFFYSYLTFNISRQLNDGFRFYKYLFIMTFGTFCTQSLGSTFGIIFYKNQRLALFISIGALSLITSFNNFMALISDFPEWKKAVSDLMFCKYVFNSILISIYGFGRCLYPERPYVLYQYSIEDDHIFWENSRNLILTYIIFKLIELLVLCIKANKFSFKFCTLYKQNERQDSCIQVMSNGCVNIEINQNTLNLKQEKSLTQSNEKLLIAWTDLSFTIKQTFSEKQIKILNELSGDIKIGSLNALMGPSGAGKTTLLKCLMDKRYSSGLDPKTEIFKNSKIDVKTCFINQENSEHLLKGLTVGQTLLYASKLKNSSKMSEEEHRTNIKDLMRELSIDDIGDNKIENCSGGQQKRVVIASELTACVRPNLLCVDEPTSGLDSTSALQVMHCLRSLSQKNDISVVAAIHQPNTNIFLMFDNIYILAKGGVCVYSGEPHKLRQHLIDCNIECTETQFPIEVMLNIASKENNTKVIENLVKTTHQNQHNLIANIEKQREVLPNGIEYQNKNFKIKDFWILLHRMIAFTYISQWKAVLIQVLVTNFLGFTLRDTFDATKAGANGCLDSNSMSNESCFISLDQWQEETHISQTIKYNFSALLFVIFLQLVVTTLTFSSDINIFINERRNGWYSSGAYYWAKSTIDVIPVIVTFLAYSWIINIYYTFDTYLGYLYLITLSVLCVQCLGHISGIIFSSNLNISLLFSFILLISQLIVSNSLIPIKDFHYIFKYLSELSFLKHSYESIIILNYGFNRCRTDQISLVLYRLGIKNEDFWYNWGYLLIHFIALKTLTQMALIIKTNVFRSKRQSDKMCENILYPISGETHSNVQLIHFKKLVVD